MISPEVISATLWFFSQDIHPRKKEIELLFLMSYGELYLTRNILNSV